MNKPSPTGGHTRMPSRTTHRRTTVWPLSQIAPQVPWSDLRCDLSTGPLLRARLSSHRRRHRPGTAPSRQSIDPQRFMTSRPTRMSRLDSHVVPIQRRHRPWARDRSEPSSEPMVVRTAHASTRQWSRAAPTTPMTMQRLGIRATIRYSRISRYSRRSTDAPISTSFPTYTPPTITLATVSASRLVVCDRPGLPGSGGLNAWGWASPTSSSSMND